MTRRRRRHRHQAADHQEDRQGVRAAESWRIFRDCRGARLPRGVGQAEPDRSCPTPVLLKGGYSDRDRGEDHAPVHRRVGAPLAELQARRARVALEPALAGAGGARTPTRSGRPRRSARRIRARRRSRLSGATGTARRSASGPAASGSRRKTTSFSALRDLLGADPSTTSRRDDSMASAVHAGVREAAARAGAADRRAEAARRRSGRSTSTASSSACSASSTRCARRSTGISRRCSACRSRATPPPVHARLPQHALHRLHRAARRPALSRRRGDRRRLGAARRRDGDGDRPPAGPRHQGESQAQLRHAAPRGLSQGAAPDEARREVPRAGHHVHRHAGRVGRTRRRGARAVARRSRANVRDVDAADARRRRR